MQQHNGMIFTKIVAANQVRLINIVVIIPNEYIVIFDGRK
jgi:hypothetical protein